MKNDELESRHKPETATEIVSEDPQPDRLQVLWGAKIWILLVAVVIAVAVYAVCHVVPKTFASTAVIVVSLPPSESLAASGNGTEAAGNLATQYAQTATLGPVVAAAAKAVGLSQGVLQNAVSAGTINGGNLITVRGEGSAPDNAMVRANAVANALVANIRLGNTTTAADYSKQVNSQLGPLNREIRTLTSRLASGHQTASEQSIAEGTLGALLTQRAALESQVAEDTASNASVSVFAPAGPGRQVAPRTTIYTAAGFVIALIVAAQLAVVISDRRRRSV